VTAPHRGVSTEILPERVVWLYYGDHLRHPFIRLAAESLHSAGVSLSIVDLAPASGRTAYEHLCRPIGDSRWIVRKAEVAATLGWMFRRAVGAKPQCIIATLPHAALAGWAAATHLKARLIYYPFELFGEQSGPVPAPLRGLEHLILRRGIDGMITQNEARARVYREERGARVAPVIVHNYKPRRSAGSPGKLRRLLGLGDEIRIVLYQGQLVHGRWLDRLLRAAAALPSDVRLVMMGEVFPWWQEHAEPMLRNPAIGDKVRVAPWVPNDELMDYVADADVGVIIYDDRVRNNYLCEPGKLSDYVSAGVPIVAPAFPTIEPVVRQYGIGRCFTSGSPEHIAEAITGVLERPRHAWQPALQRAAAELVWETQLPAFLSAIAGPTRPERGNTSQLVAGPPA
jgi:glycosyltransferase involved in cell wall biosynthesis